MFWPVVLGQLALVSPLPAQVPPSVPEGFVVISERLGSGPRANAGDRITVHFRIVSGARVIADTESRGLPFTFVIGDAGVMPLLSDLVGGLSDRSVRNVRVPATIAATRAQGLFGQGTLATDLKVYVRVLGLVK